MKTISKAGIPRHGKLRSESSRERDLFDAAREREQLQSEPVRRLARRYGLTAAMASVVAVEAGIGGARHG